MAIISRRYVQALLDSARSNDETALFGECLKDISCIYKSNDELKKILNNPIIPNETKLDIIKEAVPKCAENRVLVNFLAELLEKKRIKIIEELYEEYIKSLGELRKELNIKIIVAQKLSEEQINEITEKYKKIYNSNAVKYEIVLDETIIGGIKIIIGNTIYDSSLKTQLKEIF